MMLIKNSNRIILFLIAMFIESNSYASDNVKVKNLCTQSGGEEKCLQIEIPTNDFSGFMIDKKSDNLVKSSPAAPLASYSLKNENLNKNVEVKNLKELSSYINTLKGLDI